MFVLRRLAYIECRGGGTPTDALVEQTVQFPRENSPIKTDFLSQDQDLMATLMGQKKLYREQLHPNPQLFPGIQPAPECAVPL